MKRVLTKGARLLRNVLSVRLGRPRPIVALWEMTYRCNMRCCFCNEQGRAAQELDTAQALRLIDELRDLGTSIILLTGGEPTLRSDFGVLMDAIQRSGMASILCTNGWHVRPKLSAVLQADMVRISVDGYGEAHDRVRGCPGAFERIRGAVPLLLDAGKSPTLVTVVTRQASRPNLHQLFRVARGWGIQVDLSMVVYSWRTDPSSVLEHPPAKRQQESRLSEAPFLELLQEFEEEFADVIANPAFYRQLVRGGGLGRLCRATEVSINIRPDGSVAVPCDAYALHSLRGDLREIWATMQQMDQVRRELGSYPWCRDCYKRCIAFPSLLLHLPHLADLMTSYLPSIAEARARTKCTKPGPLPDSSTE